MKIRMSTDCGKIRSEIKNVESYPISDTLTVSCADYEKGPGAVVILESPGHVEFVESFGSKNMARIYCKQSVASYAGREGVVSNA